MPNAARSFRNGNADSKNAGAISKPRLAIAPVATLLVSVSLLVLGNGLLSTLVVVRADLEGFHSNAIGAMMSIYFAGYGAGALVLPGLVARTGHIRSFAGFAAIASAVSLLHLVLIDVWTWMALRAFSGLVYAGMILVTESWLNAHALASTRGRLLAIYGTLTMGIWALGQGLLNMAPPAGDTLFLLVSILVSSALVPVTLLSSRPPMIPFERPLNFRSLFAISPLAAIGAFLSGLALSAYWGMGPHFAQEIGLDTRGISAFMAAFLLGAMVLQWPLGFLSDQISRRVVIVFASSAAGFVGIAFVLVANAPLPMLLLLGFLFGGFGIPLYTLCVAHANDGTNASETLAIARGMLLLNGLGAVLGPLSATFAMNRLGPDGLFVHASAALLLLSLMALLRRAKGPDESAVPSPLPHAPQIAMTLDTRCRAGKTDD